MHPVVKNITALIFTEPHVIPVREPERDLVNNANPALRGDTRHLSALLQESATLLARSVPEVVHGPRKPERNTNFWYLPEERCKSCTMDTEWVYTHIRPQSNLFHHEYCCYQVKSPLESHASPQCGVFSSICASTDAAMVLADRQTVHRFTPCFQNEGTQRVYLPAWRKAHVLCPLPWPRGNCSIVRMFWRLWYASQSPGKLGSKPRGMTSHTNPCCEFPVDSLDKFLRVSSRSERNEHGTIRSDSPEDGGICLHSRTLRVQRV